MKRNHHTGLSTASRSAAVSAAIILIALTMMLTGCRRRHYQIQRVRVPVDTMAHRDTINEEEKIEEIIDGEPIIEIPDYDKENLRVNDPDLRKNKLKYNNFMEEAVNE
jgi:ABC-type metal ion transport system substrate-binding protein